MSKKSQAKPEEIKSTKIEKSDFEKEIDKYIKHIDSQANIVPLVTSLIRIKLRQEAETLDSFINKNTLSESFDEKENTGKLIIPSDKIKDFLRLNSQVETTSLAFNLLPINFVVSFVSQYDAYLGGLIRSIFKSQPGLLSNSEKNISFSELVKFSSIEEAYESFIEKEVESVLRESHLKQFKWLESKLNTPLTKDLPSFSDFIEITERRNLFVHCNGTVSRQYLEVCKENKVKDIENVTLGEQLTVSPTYFKKCYIVLFEIGVKLGQVIWRKLKPDELEAADSHLNDVCYQLLIDGHYNLALNLLTFATEILKKHIDQEMICILNINKALAYYLLGKKEECVNSLNKCDWSATSDKFKLATSVIREEYPKSIQIMKSIGASNQHINKDAYREWPLFKNFRKTKEFKLAYKEIFNEDFVYLETKPRKLEDILTEINRLKGEVEIEKNIENEIKAETMIENVTGTMVES